MTLRKNLFRDLARLGGKSAGRFVAIAAGALALIIANGVPAYCFPWSIDMFRGPAIQPLEMSPRVMPQDTLPVDGIHYDIHYGQPPGMATQKALPKMSLELMTVQLKNPLKPTPVNLAHGKMLFVNTCSPCHGIHGRGNGSVVHLLHHKPADLLTGVAKNLPDGYIFGYIRNGGIWMPSYDDAMSQKERWQVVLYVRHLEKLYGGKKTASTK